MKRRKHILQIIKRKRKKCMRNIGKGLAVRCGMGKIVLLTVQNVQNFDSI